MGKQLRVGNQRLKMQKETTAILQEISLPDVYDFGVWCFGFVVSLRAWFLDFSTASSFDPVLGRRCFETSRKVLKTTTACVKRRALKQGLGGLPGFVQHTRLDFARPPSALGTPRAACGGGNTRHLRIMKCPSSSQCVIVVMDAVMAVAVADEQQQQQ